MSGRGVVPAPLAAVASLAAVLPLTTLVTTMSWFARCFWLVVIVVGVGMAVRARLTTRGVVIVAVQLLAVLLAVTWQDARATTWYGLPTLDTAREVSRLLGQFAQTVYYAAAPVPSNPGVDLTFALIGVLVAILVDHIAVTREAPAAAGLPLLAAYVAAAANNGTTLAAPYFLIPAVAWLVLLARAAQLSMRGWASTVATPLTPFRDEDPVHRFGTIARRAGIGVLLLALAVPTVMPHLPTRFVLDGLARNAEGRGNARVGYSSTLDVSRSLTGGDATVVFRYSTTAPAGTPLRVLAASSFDGTTWTRPAPQLGRAARLDIAPGLPRVERIIAVDDYRLDPPALATPQPLAAGDFNGVSWQVDQATSDVYVQTRPASYSTTYYELGLTPDLLRDGTDGVAGEDPIRPTRELAVALQLDPRSEALVRQLTSTVAGSAPTRYDAALAIQEWLRSTGGFSYTLTLPDVRGPGDAPLDPVSAFFASKRGYCVQFSTAMVLMARAAGIPARMAIGFLPGSLQDGRYTVVGSDAHSWPELYFPGAGWVRFEPTPATRTGTAPAWTERVVTPTAPVTSAPRSSIDPLDRPDRAPLDGTDTPAGGLTELDQPLLDKLQAWLADPVHLAWLTVALGLLGLLVLPATALLLRRLRRAGGAPAERAEATFGELSIRLTDLGLPPPPSGTLRDWQGHYSRVGYLGEPSREALGALLRTVERARYARPGSDLDVDAIDDQAKVVLHAVFRTRSWQQRARAVLFPGDARAWWRTRLARLGAAVSRRMAPVAAGIRRLGRRG
ncbi:MAG TPA: DUF3488 and transglutaminase-like domain-containing protein [Dermatophilaceae bacterium]|nr:DUF3488 and transglutaminase-like domain-containing protein [Dermatophilaceae bacterium]